MGGKKSNQVRGFPFLSIVSLKLQLEGSVTNNFAYLHYFLKNEDSKKLLQNCYREMEYKKIRLPNRSRIKKTDTSG